MVDSIPPTWSWPAILKANFQFFVSQLAALRLIYDTTLQKCMGQLKSPDIIRLIYVNWCIFPPCFQYAISILSIASFALSRCTYVCATDVMWAFLVIANQRFTHLHTSYPQGKHLNSCWPQMFSLKLLFSGHSWHWNTDVFLAGHIFRGCEQLWQTASW